MLAIWLVALISSSGWGQQVHEIQKLKFFYSAKEVAKILAKESKNAIKQAKNGFIEEAIDPHQKPITGHWSFLAGENHVLTPSKVLHPDYVNGLFVFDPQIFIKNHQADNFLDAKEKYYRSLKYSFVKKIYQHQQTTLSDWGGLNHPPIRSIKAEDLEWITDLRPRSDSKKNLRLNEDFQKKIDTLSDSELTTGNELLPFEDGKVLPLILNLVKNSEHTLWGSALLYACDESTKPLTEALKERARSGVDVRIMVDWGLQKLQRGGCLKELKKSGVKVYKVRGIALHNSAFHVKLWVSDFEQGILLGANLIDVETLSNGFNHLYHDSGVQVTGPAVTDIAKRFLDLWKTYHRKENKLDREAAEAIELLSKKEKDNQLRGTGHYQEWLAQNKKVCRVVVQERHTMRDRISKTLLEYLKTANDKIWVASVRRKFNGIDEDDSGRNELLTETRNRALKKNVKVEFILNTSATPFTPSAIPSSGIETVGKKTLINKILTKSADASASKSIHDGSQFFEESYEMTKNFRAWSYFTFNHNKNVIIDQDFVMTGSYNPMSERSTNDAEIAIFCQDHDLNQTYTQNMARDLVNSVAYPFRSQIVP